jgi:hypothetical protein
MPRILWVSGVTAPHIHNFGTRGKCAVSFNFRPLYPPGKSSEFSLERRLGGSIWKTKNSCPCPNINPESSVVLHVAQIYTDWAIWVPFLLIGSDCKSSFNWIRIPPTDVFRKCRILQYFRRECMCLANTFFNLMTWRNKIWKTTERDHFWKR